MNGKSEVKQIGLSLLMGFLLTVLVISHIEAHERQVLLSTQESLATEVLRFHVIANSNTENDQEVKLEVKEAVIEYMKEHLSPKSSVMETKVWVENNLTQIEDVSREVLREFGMDQVVVAELEDTHFPKKVYGDVSFPEGKYEALRVEIGKAEGENWWCCLYPNLCFVDATYGVVSDEGKEQLQTVLTEEEYELITEERIEIEWFFF